MSEHKPGCIDYVEFPVSSTAGLAESQAFFAQAFGWVFQQWGPDYADTASSGIGSGFSADVGERAAKPLVVLYADDLEAARARVVAAGGEITRPVFEFPGGRRFHFREPGGNELAVWSDKP